MHGPTEGGERQPRTVDRVLQKFQNRKLNFHQHPTSPCAPPTLPGSPSQLAKMVKPSGSKLLNALQKEKGFDYKQEKQKRMRKEAEKKKRSKKQPEEDAEEDDSEEDESGGVGVNGTAQEDASKAKGAAEEEAQSESDEESDEEEDASKVVLQSHSACNIWLSDCLLG